MPGLLMLRHAESTWNAAGRWQGQADPPLSPTGEYETRAAAERLAVEGPFDLAVTSDLERARATAALLLEAFDPRPPVRMEPALREYDVGEWSGLTRQAIEARWPGAIKRFAERDLAAPPGGEDRQSFDERVSGAIRRIALETADEGVGRLLVIAHGGVIRSLARTAGLPDVRIGHLAGYRGFCDEGGLSLGELVDLLDSENMSSELSL